MVISAHAYPWDVIGDPAFVERVLESDVDSVTLAASYHTTRAATPNHPLHKVVDVPFAALYRPGSPYSYGEGDWFGDAFGILRAAGIKVNAWIVLAHSTRVGRADPSLTVVNCFGERYPYALCPSNPNVVDYCVDLAERAVRDVPVDGVSLESCGQMGLFHLGCHEKTDGAFTPLQQNLLSICCCSSCGVPASTVRQWFSSGREPAGEVLAVRHEAADRLRAAVLAVLPSGVPVTLHGQPDPWATGPSPGLTPQAVSDVDSVLVPCWPLGSSVPAGMEAYVSALPPFGASVEKLHEHVRQLALGGASGLALYHLGLTTEPAPLFRSLAKAFRDDNTAV